MEGLTERQKQILEYIEAEIARRGFPPTHREIAEYFGFRSPYSALSQIKALEKKGYLEIERGASRGVKLSGGMEKRYPLLGEVAAGEPKLAVQSADEALTLDDAVGARPGDFLLRIKGDSMIAAGIHPGDIAVVRPQAEARNGDIAVVMVGDEEATIKRFYRERGGRIRLVPENPEYEPIIINPAKTPVRIIGVIEGLIKRFR